MKTYVKSVVFYCSLGVIAILALVGYFWAAPAVAAVRAELDANK